MFNQKISALLAISSISSPTPLAATLETQFAKQSISASNRASSRKMQNLLAPPSFAQSMGAYVGQLQELWQFPSDHLPIGISYDDIHFASWNVLDSNFMDWVIEKNSQGLSRSLIADEHVYIGDSGLTLRDKHVADLILQMIFHPTHPRSMIALQECNPAFIQELRAKLPASFEIIFSHGDAIIIDKSKFAIIETQEICGVFAQTPKRTFQQAALKRLDTDEIIRFINVHLPGDPLHPARFEFANYLARTFDPNQTIIAMGDMNFDEIEMADAMRKAFLHNNLFSLYSPYCTNISPYVFNSKAIDHFLIYSPKNSPGTVNDPEEVMPNLSPYVSLLEHGPLVNLPIE